jgi:hypothetical protein
MGSLLISVVGSKIENRLLIFSVYFVDVDGAGGFCCCCVWGLCKVIYGVEY